MKAIVIRGASQTIETIELGDSDEIAALVGQDSIISDEVDAENAVYFDEDCFIRGTEGRFQIDNLAPIAGIAVVTGVNAGAPADTSLTPEALGARVKFL